MSFIVVEAQEFTWLMLLLLFLRWNSEPLQELVGILHVQPFS